MAQTARGTNWYLFAVYPTSGNAPDNGYPIGTECGTIKEAESRIRWMIVGGFERTTYHIARPIQGMRGAFITLEGRVLRPTRGALTEAAFSEMLAKIWGEE